MWHELLQTQLQEHAVSGSSPCRHLGPNPNLMDTEGDECGKVVSAIGVRELER